MNAEPQWQEDEATSLPHAIEAEQLILGLCMATPATVSEFAAVLSPEHFHDPLHQDIYETILDRYRTNEPYWPEFVGRDMRNDPRFGKDLDLGYIARLARAARDCAGVPVDLPALCELVMESASRRALLTVTEEFRDDLLLNTGTGAQELADKVSATLLGAAEGFQGARKREAGLMEAAMAYLTAEEAPYSPTGLKSLDHVIGGLRAGNSILIGGRPSMGKSAFAVTMVYKSASRGDPTVMHSLEMSVEEVTFRLVSEYLKEHKGIHLPYSVLMRKRAEVIEWESVKEAMAVIDKWPLRIIEGNGLTIEQIRADTLRHRQHFASRGRKLALVVIDYLQLIEATDLKWDTVRATTHASKGIKNLAKHLGVPVIALSQLSRAVEQRNDKRPMLSDLRESGAIEQDADIVIFMYRDAYYLERERPPRDAGEEADWRASLGAAKAQAEAIVAKNRHGETATVMLGCDMPTNHFWDIEGGDV